MNADFLDHPEITPDSEIRFYLVDEAEKISSQEPIEVNQSEVNGTIGIVIASYKTKNDPPDQALSAVYNFSAPCPPTCGHIGT